MTQKQALERYEELKRNIQRSTPVPTHETPREKEARIASLKADFDAFCKYYFPDYFDPEKKGAEFGWFHREAADQIINDPDIFAVLEWPREHAKSVFADIFLPLYLKAIGELEGLILSSNSGDKAKGLLSDIQGQLESNQRYINDYGQQYSLGSWTEGEFVTRDGVGFWAVGKRQSPRGIREGEKRPNFLIIDDLDDDEEVRNEALIEKSLDWMKGALIGALSLIRSRVVMVGNRIAKNSILAHTVGDIEESDPKKEGITHIKVYALENPITHEEDQSEQGVPAWKERYDRSHLLRRMKIMGYRMAQREFFHRQIKEGKIFKNEWLVYAPMPDYKYFEAVTIYCDPSFKDSKKNDFKAIVALGRIGNKVYMLDCWIRQASRGSMAAAHYDMHAAAESKHPRLVKSYIEANFMQDQMIQDYLIESIERGYLMPINEDKRQKPNKLGRIENLSPLFERGLVVINEELRGSLDYEVFKSQLTGFPNDHDDGPDAFEGAYFKLKELHRTNRMPVGGTYQKRNQF